MLACSYWYGDVMFITEIDSIYFRSEGYNKMNLSEQLLKLYEKKTNIYQVYEYPISISDVKSVYKRFNKEFFNGKLPDVRLKWASLAKNFYGKYHHIYNDDGTAKDRLITLATTLQKDNELFENILLHEIIHVYQWYMSEKTGDKKYLDDEGVGSTEWFFNPEKDKHKRGHGKTFYAEMKRINKSGYDVTVTGDLQVEKELTKPVYGIVFHSASERGVFVWSVTDPKNHMDTIIASLEEVAGTGFFTSYIIIKTTDTVVNTGLRLTKAFELPKNSQNIYIASEAIGKYLANSKLSTLVGGNDLAPSGENDQTISPDETQLLSRIHKWRSSDFRSYLITFFNNTPKYAALIETDAYKCNNWGSELSGRNGWEYGDEIKGIPVEVIETVRKDWMNISDVEIKPVFKYSTTGLYAAIGNHEKIDDRYIKQLQKTYDDKFDGRLSMEKFKAIYYKVVLSGLKKDAKKYNKPFDAKAIENVLRQVILKGTILEQNLSEQLLMLYQEM